MKDRWNADAAAPFADDPVAMRAHTSQLLGADPDLVLHGGGNTSVKVDVPNLFGETERVLYVKGSGWDLATIRPQGFAPVRLEVLERMAGLQTLSDADMVRHQKAAMIDPGAPGPSVEAILHAVLPFTFVDHSHADAVVAVSNSPGGPERLQALYGDRVLFLPYVMPGFELARAVAERIAELGEADWARLEGLVLLHHGVFTWGDTAELSYRRMVALVDEAEQLLQAEGAWEAVATAEAEPFGRAEALALAAARKAACDAAGRAMLATLNRDGQAAGFAALPNVRDVATRGPVTPDHVIHTKRVPVVFDGGAGGLAAKVTAYAATYAEGFARLTDGTQTMVDPAPRWGVWPGQGVVAFGPSVKRTRVVRDISAHTTKCIQWGEALGGWKALSEAELFQMEYWELEQAKLKRAGASPPFAGRVALVTGAASGIGRACVEALVAEGCAVGALDLDPEVAALAQTLGGAVLPLVADVTDAVAVEAAVVALVERFGGVDVVVSNAGTFPKGARLTDMDASAWDRTVAVNLSGHQRVLTATAPFLERGVAPAVIVVGSKNVPAPGKGVAAYSASKAGLTQLARVAALELGEAGVRVNVLHPNAVFDTGIWTEERVAERAAAYGLDVAAYKRRNVLKAEVTSADVANLAVAMAGPLFRATTGAQVPVDGGTERVI